VSTAATAPGSTRSTSLLEELEGVLGTFVALPLPARDAVVSAVASLVGESETTADERDAAVALLTLARALPRS
jgi:hypothetical protein